MIRAALVCLLLLGSTARADCPFDAPGCRLSVAPEALPLSGPLPTDRIGAATYSRPTGRYPHGVLGDAIEYGGLVLRLEGVPAEIEIVLPETRVFEDLQPRLADIDGDGRAEVVVVESHRDRGARLAVYDLSGLSAATGWIGRRFRWLAPAGIADLDGDGRVELAYVETPHLGKTLRLVRKEGTALVEVAALGGVTNHRIGEAFITGGLRACGAAPSLILADAGWQRIVEVTYAGGALQTKDRGPFEGAASAAAAQRC